MSKRNIKIGKISKLNLKSLSTSDCFDIIQYLDTGNITKNNILNLQILKSKKDKIPSRAKRRVKKNTIIYSTVRPNQEHYGFLENPENNLIVSTGFTTIDIIDENIDPKFIYYLITQKQITDYLHTIGMSATSSYPSIKPEDIGNLKFKIPENIQDQQKIASVLSTLDAKIELNNRINSELEAMAKTLYDYWFVQFDFPDYQGRPYKSSGGEMMWSEELKRDIPKGWEVEKLGEIFEFEKGIEPGSSEYLDSSINNNCIKFFRVGDIEGDSSVYVDSSNKKYVIAKERDVIVTFDGSVGKLGFGLNGAFSGGLRKIYDKTKKIDNSLVYFIFRDERIIATIHKYATGSILLHASSSIDHLRIPFEENIYLKFQEITKPIFDQMVKNKQENQKLAELRDWLLPMLMNGQVVVR